MQTAVDTLNHLDNPLYHLDTGTLLCHLGAGTLFRDRDALWRVCEGGDTDNIRAQRIASWSVNGTGELVFTETLDGSSENYNAHNGVVLVDGIYTVF